MKVYNVMHKEYNADGWGSWTNKLKSFKNKDKAEVYLAEQKPDPWNEYWITIDIVDME